MLSLVMRKQRQYRLGSYPVLNVVFSIALALFIIGLFGLLLLHAARLTGAIREQVRIQVYLHKNITESERIKLRQLLSKKDFVFKKHSQAQIRFISREEATKDFLQATGEDFLQVLNDTPLRDVYWIRIDPDYQSQDCLQAIKSELEAMTGVFEVDFIQDFVASINRNITRVGTILGAFAIILLVAVSALINNTIKLALYSQRFLVRSMKLVGATASFVRKPFLVRAALIGLLSGTLANSILLLLLHYTNRHIPALVRLQEPLKIFSLLGALLALGVLISWVGTYRAINKHLGMSLDDLY